MKPNRQQTGFTLLEIIAVISIMAILTATIAPSLVREIDRANADAESSSLQEIAAGLVDYSSRERRIPSGNPNDWAAAVAEQLAMPEAQLRNNRRGFRRRLIFDPLFMTATPTNFSGYLQTTGLTSPPVQPRALLISDLRANVPNLPNNAVEFERVWNEDPSARILPDEFTKIERISFRNLFQRVLLTNQRTEMPAYSLDAGAAVTVPAAAAGTDGLVSIFALRGTELRLFASPFPAGNLHTAFLVNADTSRRYQTDGFSWTWEEP